MEPSNCPWCGEWSRYIVVNGHYECPRCKNVVADCCDGEQACPVDTPPQKPSTTIPAR